MPKKYGLYAKDIEIVTSMCQCGVATAQGNPSYRQLEGAQEEKLETIIFWFSSKVELRLCNPTMLVQFRQPELGLINRTAN